MLMVITLVLNILEVIFGLVTMSGLIVFCGQWSLIILMETLVEIDPCCPLSSSKSSSKWSSKSSSKSSSSFINSIHLLAGLGESVHCVLDPTIENSQWIPSTYYLTILQYYWTLNEYHCCCPPSTNTTTTTTTTTTYYMEYLTTLLNSHWCPPSTDYMEYFTILLRHIPVYFYLPPYFCPRQERHNTISITNTVIQIRKIIMVLIKGTFWFWAHFEFRGFKVYTIFLQLR